MRSFGAPDGGGGGAMAAMGAGADAADVGADANESGAGAGAADDSVCPTGLKIVICCSKAFALAVPSRLQMGQATVNGI